MTTANVFFLGLDDFARKHLETIRGAENYEFIGIFDADEVSRAQSYDMRELLHEAEKRIRSHPKEPDAVVGHFDFPVSTMLPVLRARLALSPQPTLESVLRCEHKYWSRCIQEKVVPDQVPPFELVNPFDDDAADKVGLPFPFWLKPVKSLGSHLGFKINDREDLEIALDVARHRIRRIAEPFDELLRHADLPPEIACADGHHMVAEGLIGGNWQGTLEGFVHAGRVETYGVIDSIRHPNGSSFDSYRYPSTIDDGVRERLETSVEKVLEAMRLDESAFNIEYFYDADEDRIWLLEINTRISASHVPLFQMVHGRSHHEVVVELGLGHRPQYSGHDGPCKVAAKFMVREERDGVVTRVPSAAQIEAIEREIPHVRIVPDVREGDRLSELEDQDSYTYQVAEIFIGGEDNDELRDKYERCLERMDLCFIPDEAESGREVPVESRSPI